MNSVLRPVRPLGRGSTFEPREAAASPGDRGRPDDFVRANRPGREERSDPLHSHRRVLRFAAPIVAALALLLAPGTAHADPSKAQLQAQIDAASTKLEKTVEQYNKSAEELKAVQAAIAKLDAELGHSRGSATTPSVK